MFQILQKTKNITLRSAWTKMEDLTGKLIIKVALGDDIRRIPIHNEVKAFKWES